MNDQDNQTTSHKPEFIAYSVKENKDGKAYWNKIGAVWPHRDGKGYDIDLDSLPIDGRISLRSQRDQYAQRNKDQRQALDIQTVPTRAQHRDR